jgi:hypothetical protein
MDRKLRNRPTMFMNSVRPKSAVFKFQVWPQKRSQNLFYNLAQTLLRILPIAGVLEGEMTSNLVGGRKRQFLTKSTKSIVGHYINNQLPNESIGPYSVHGRLLILKIMPEFFDFDTSDMLWMPIWIRFPNLPLQCWSPLCLSKLASVIGKPQHPP